MQFRRQIIQDFPGDQLFDPWFCICHLAGHSCWVCAAPCGFIEPRCAAFETFYIGPEAQIAGVSNSLPLRESLLLVVQRDATATDRILRRQNIRVALGEHRLPGVCHHRHAFVWIIESRGGHHDLEDLVPERISVNRSPYKLLRNFSGRDFADHGTPIQEQVKPLEIFAVLQQFREACQLAFHLAADDAGISFSRQHVTDP